MEAIGQLTAGLAHDFNNLLHVTSGNQEVALELIGDSNEAAARAIGRAQSAIAKAAKLTQQLLTFARKQRLEPKRVNLNALVIEFSEMLIRTLGERVDLHLDLKPGIPSCEVDPTHLEMALLNVLINARDAMPNGGKVTVGTSLLQDRERVEAHGLLPGRYVVMCVVDEGEGMPPEVARRATEPFFTTKGPGTGLGLAMVHGFVQQSHGQLEIDSAPGKGTSIRMIFPAADRSALDIMADRIEMNRAGNGPNWNVEAILERKTILLVDDSQDIRELSGAFLQSQGYRVVSAASGEEALDLLERYGDVDMLFTDIIMPGGMNGLQLMRKVRQRQPAIPVLIATGYMDDLTSVSGMRSGVEPEDGPLNILPKPFRLNDLAERVRAALKTDTPPSPVRDFRHEG
jgi:CheY-like chemotaxis protein